MTIALVNYGLGNIKAYANIYRVLNIPCMVANSSEELKQASKIILPGVGAFDWAMKRLNQSGMRDTLDELVLNQKTPVLGICVGMQMMAKKSEEGSADGLGWVDAEVVRFNDGQLKQAPLPHMGWNDVVPLKTDCLFKGIDAPRYYYLHSYYFCAHQESDVLATTFYGSEFTAAIASDNIYGTQFHPEKSHRWGIDLLNNFYGL